MTSDWPTASRHDARRVLNQAREAAEALFTPKQLRIPTPGPTASAPAGSSSAAPAHAEPRQARVFGITATGEIGGEKQGRIVATPEAKARRPSSRHPAPKILLADHGRILALVQYGLTPEQVADLYGVSPEQIERIVAAK